MTSQKPDPAVLSAEEHQHLLKKISEGAVSAEELQNIPEQHRNFFTMALGAVRKHNPAGKMNLLGKARPEEIEALNKANISLEEVPEDVAKFLQSKGYHTDEASQLEAMSKHNLDINTLKSVNLENATSEQKQEFNEMLNRWNQDNITIIDSAKPAEKKVAPPVARPTTAAPTPTPAPQPVPAAGHAGFFSHLDKPDAPFPIPQSLPDSHAGFFTQLDQPAAPLPPAPPPVEKKEAPVIEAVAHICKKCSWDNNKEYPATPTQSDIDSRIISIASAAQGGDGRFRKDYSLFQNQIKLTFRELTTEGETIYNCEQGRVMQFANAHVTEATQWFSLNRIQLRRFHCGLEKVSRPGFSVEIPPLESWILQYGGDAEKALTELTNYIQTTVLPVETMKLGVSNLWLEFEDLVQKLWRDQSFYKGSR
jgi:hypothetical protein